MKTSVDISNGIKITVYPQPKKKKTDKASYDLYLLFNVTQNSVPIYNSAISTGLTVAVSEWKKSSKEMKGNNTRAQLINGKLLEYLNISKTLLEDLRGKGLDKCTDLKSEISHTIKSAITGKAPKGESKRFQSKLLKHSYKSVKESCLASKTLSKGRIEKYERGEVLLTEFFDGNIPLVSAITEDDLSSFKIWFQDQFHGYRQNTLNTYFSCINAVFNYAKNKMKIIKGCPVPSGFAGSVEKVDIDVLEEAEVMSIIKLEDSKLTRSQRVGKYCMLLQMLTGIGHGDLKTLKREHLKYSSSLGWKIEKNRNKTNVRFTVFTTANAKHVYDKLRELTAGTDYVFKLTSVEYATRIYKEIAKKAGIGTRVSTYTCRHTFAVNYMDNGGRLEDLQSILGHKDISSTQVYAKISNLRLSQRAKELEQKSVIHQLHDYNKTNEKSVTRDERMVNN